MSETADRIEEESIHNRSRIPLPGIIGGISLLAIIIRALFAPWQATFPDSFTYLKLSECISDGSFFIENWGTGLYSFSLTKSFYAMLIGGLSFIINDRQTVATLISILCGGFLLIPVFYLGKTLFGNTSAWVSAVLVFFSPYLIQYSGWVLTESLFIFLFISSISLTIVLLTTGGKWYSWILLGMLSGLVYITREVGIMTPPLIFLLVVVHQTLIKRAGYKKTALVLVSLILGFLIIYLPAKSAQKHKDMVMMNHIGHAETESAGDPVRVSLGVRLGTMVENLIYTKDLHNNKTEYESSGSRLTPDGSRYLSMREGETSRNAHVITVLWEKKSLIADMVWKGMTRYGGVLWRDFSVILIIFTIIGLFFHLLAGKVNRETLFKRFFLPLWAIGYFSLLILSGSANFVGIDFELHRYMTPVFPIIFLWTGYGVLIGAKWLAVLGERLGLKWNNKGIQQWGIIVGATGLTILVVATFLPQAKGLSLVRSQPSFPRLVGEEIRKRSSRSPLVMARTRAIPYYAGGGFLVTPYEPYDRVIEFARIRKVNFIVITIGDNRPLLRNMLSISGPKPGLTLEFGVPDRRNPDSLVLAVYKVLDS